MKEKKALSNSIWLFVILGGCAVVSAFVVPNFIQGNSRGNAETSCRSNLKNLSTAMEMYSTDWQGHYPSSLSTLTPNYLISIPACPVSRASSYRAVIGPGVGYNKGHTSEDGIVTPPYSDYYLIWCEGDEHKRQYGTPENFPQFDGITGMIDY